MIRCNVWKDLQSWLYPSVCSACHKPLDWADAPICLPCEAKLPYAFQTFGQSNALFRRLQGRTHLQAAGYFLEYKRDSMGAELLHKIKYDTHLKLLAYLLQQWSKEWEPEGDWRSATLIPVPPNRWQSRKRGYHAASEMAEVWSRFFQFPVNHKVLNRRFLTRSQTRLNRGDRWSNLNGIYTINQREMPAGPILLMDDVVTTGATVERCLNLLQSHTDSPIGLLSLAYTL
jgi:predicted amidophosphoribosyltransferase